MDYLPENDEFHNIHFLQVSDAGAIEVKAATYALMCWWKDVLGNEDTININPETSNSFLNWSSFIEVDSNNFDTELGSLRFAIENIIEVDEEGMSITYFMYIGGGEGIPYNLLEDFMSNVATGNTVVPFGHGELLTVEAETGPQTLFRFRDTVDLSGIRIGKVDVVRKFVENAQRSFVLLLEHIAQQPSLRAWLSNPDVSSDGESDELTLSDAEDVEQRIKQLLQEGGSKARAAELLFKARPNSSRSEMIEDFIRLIGLTKAGASTYYSNLKKNGDK